jgi:uncharacterized membrane protein
MTALLAAFLLGIIAGLRSLTAPAVLLLVRHRSVVAYLLGVLAIIEYAADLHPNTPARTQVVGLGARILSGAFCGGWLAAAGHVSLVLGVLLGVVGAVMGAYVGLAARTGAIGLIGRVPAALLEDALAIVGAVLTVTYE